MASRRTERVALLFAALTLASCAELGRENSLFDERIATAGLDASRQYALRVATFVRGDEIGGYVVFFEVDGELNTSTDPYFVPAFCSYFGPGPLREGQFRIVADAPDGRELVAQGTVDRRERTLSLVVADGADLLETTGPNELAVDLDRVRDTDPELLCPETRQERVVDGSGV
jgi:hypothetical protein